MQLYTFIVYLMLFSLLVSVLGDWVVNTVSAYMLVKEKQTEISRTGIAHDCLLYDLHQALPALHHWKLLDKHCLIFKTNLGTIEWKVENSWLTRTMTQEGGKQKSVLLPRVADFSVATIIHKERVQIVQIQWVTRGILHEMAIVPGGL
jgi:hypothetical protein